MSWFPRPSDIGQDDTDDDSRPRQLERFRAEDDRIREQKRRRDREVYEQQQRRDSDAAIGREVERYYW